MRVPGRMKRRMGNWMGIFGPPANPPFSPVHRLQSEKVQTLVSPFLFRQLRLNQSSCLSDVAGAPIAQDIDCNLRTGLGSQHLVGGGWGSSISSSATSHDIPVQTTNSDSRVWTQRPGKTFWLQNFNNNRIACVEKLSVKSGWGKGKGNGKRPTKPLQLSN